MSMMANILLAFATIIALLVAFLYLRYRKWRGEFWVPPGSNFLAGSTVAEANAKAHEKDFEYFADFSKHDISQVRFHLGCLKLC
jgi:hypothetical protein